MAKGFGVSPITNTIYYGTQDHVKHIWTGKKEDVTDKVIAAVYEWFMGNMDGNEEYSITFPSTEFELVMRRKKSKEE
jgi:hypothetical protein